MTLRQSLTIGVVAVALAAMLPGAVWAQIPPGAINPANPNTINPNNIPTITNPLGDVKDPRVLVGKIISAALGVVGSISLVIFLYGGFTWMTSGGSPDKVKHGRDLIVWAAIGLFVIFASYAMVRWVLETITLSTRN